MKTNRLDTAFENWFSEFFDGEGYFYVAMVRNQNSKTGRISRDVVKEFEDNSD